MTEVRPGGKPPRGEKGTATKEQWVVLRSFEVGSAVVAEVSAGGCRINVRLQLGLRGPQQGTEGLFSAGGGCVVYDREVDSLLHHDAGARVVG